MLVLGLFLPGQGQEPVDVVPGDRGLRRHGAHELQFLELVLHLAGGFGAHLLPADAALEFLDLALEVLLFPHLLLDGPHLLVEIVFPLGLFHLLLDPVLDAGLDLEDFVFPVHIAHDLFQAAGSIQVFQQALFFIRLDGQMAGDGVGQAPRVIHPHQALQGFLGDLFVQLGISLEPGDRGAAQGLGLGSDIPGLQQFLGLHLEELGNGQKLAGDGPALAFHQHLDGAVGQPQELQDGRQGSQPVNLALPGFILARVLLGA